MPVYRVITGNIVLVIVIMRINRDRICSLLPEQG